MQSIALILQQLGELTESFASAADLARFEQLKAKMSGSPTVTDAYALLNAGYRLGHRFSRLFRYLPSHIIEQILNVRNTTLDEDWLVDQLAAQFAWVARARPAIEISVRWNHIEVSIDMLDYIHDEGLSFSSGDPAHIEHSYKRIYDLADQMGAVIASVLPRRLADMDIPPKAVNMRYAVEFDESDEALNYRFPLNLAFLRERLISQGRIAADKQLGLAPSSLFKAIERLAKAVNKLAYGGPRGKSRAEGFDPARIPTQLVHVAKLWTEFGVPVRTKGIAPYTTKKSAAQINKHMNSMLSPAPSYRGVAALDRYFRAIRRMLHEFTRLDKYLDKELNALMDIQMDREEYRKRTRRLSGAFSDTRMVKQDAEIAIKAADAVISELYEIRRELATDARIYGID